MNRRMRAASILLAILMAACSGGELDGNLLDLDCLYCDLTPPPKIIFINAGEDQVVIAQDMVRFASSDLPSQGCKAEYSWKQLSGPKAKMWSPYPHRSAEITTPLVYRDTELMFRFTGTCGNGTSKSDDVTVLVQPTSAVAMCASAPLYATSYAWNEGGCVTSPADIAGDSRVATIYRDSEVEPHDSLQLANSLNFPTQIAGESVAANALASVTTMKGESPDATDFFHIYT